MITKIKLDDGRIQFAVLGMTCDAAIDIFNEIDGTMTEEIAEEISDTGADQIFRFFDTINEATAYMQGVEDISTFNYTWLTMQEFEMIFGKLEGAIQTDDEPESEPTLPADLESTIIDMVQEAMGYAFTGSKYIDGQSPEEYVKTRLAEANSISKPQTENHGSNI